MSTDWIALARQAAPGRQLLDARPLEGGTSSSAVRLEFEAGPPLVARRHAAAATEFRLLSLLAPGALPVPSPVYLEAPVIVTEFIEGEPTQAQHARGIAELMAQLHAVDTAALDFLPRQTLDEPADNPPVLLHADLWPGNLLWRGTQLAGVIDWEDAALGDPLADLANTRYELALAYDDATVDAFTARYLELRDIDTRQLNIWERRWAERAAPQLANWASDAATLERLRAGHARFVARWATTRL